MGKVCKISQLPIPNVNCIQLLFYQCLYVVRGYLPASEDIKDNLMGVDRVQEELQKLNQLKQVCIRCIE